MFTFADIITIAVQIEKNGEEAYRKTALLVNDTDLKEMLLWMAEEEKKHAAWFTQLNPPRNQTKDQEELEQMGRSLLQSMVKDNSFLLDQQELLEASTVKEIIERSRILEEDTILFYEFLTGFLDNEDTVEQLKKIIHEEKAHSKTLEHYSKKQIAESSKAGSS